VSECSPLFLHGHQADDYALMHPCPSCGKLIPPDWARCAVCENDEARRGEDWESSN